ncbi:probable LRR receptor-like serine/threonine-protein kinase At1g05700 isoform X2 [Hevea brasiliensis]|uniref:probable LRR receptor-like serine/threonine-protein kinase At1g05700 isoform X2 n=1 Tax=Hevea brasiliensis TaxID=3981 RepID=UPI0025EEE559|nr:probable LRR receptor-like serine/threonine-protein kinase At1g05700 isoform X2 [Hevea brasiliensis]
MVQKCRGIWAWGYINGFILLQLLVICLETKGSNVFASGVSKFSNSEPNFIIQKHSRRKLDDVAGSINIDCGMPEDFSYTDAITDIQYISDRTFIDTGVNKNISANFISDELPMSAMTLRSFPQGKRNCYALRPPEGKASIYLIRASFMYGNYDDLDKLPEFRLYIGVNLWDKVKFDNASHMVSKEIIHVPTIDDIYVCLLNTGSGTPFISALELRHFHNSTYKAESVSLVLYRRLDFGSTANEIVRYHDDAYDRIWFPYNCPQCASINTSSAVDSLVTTDFNLPSKVMQTAVQPINADEPLKFEFDIGDPNENFYIYMHFAEILQMNQSREFNIELNGVLLQEGVVLKYLRSTTLPFQSVRGAKLSFCLFKLPNSTLPPILNALEIYLVRDFWQQPTDREDVKAIEDIKSIYNVVKGWQGDPCIPLPSWDGLNCNDNGYNPPRIISFGLTGEIDRSLSNLKLLQHLDLSENSLTGGVPEFLSELPYLRTLNLAGNKLSGSVPLALLERSISGSLTLRLVGNPELCLWSPCKEERKSALVPIVATIVPLVVILMAMTLIILCIYKRKKVARMLVDSRMEEGSSLKSHNRQFTYAEIVRMTNNFSTVIGKGGFGTVYHGYLSDDTQVAVKMLSPTSGHGSTQFPTEAHLLMRVHHRNLASFIGYCNEIGNIGIVYEYMACGNLEHYLSDKTVEVLGWKERLQIALDAAQGLEYLHHGCKPPIIHRDVKSANILLNDNLQAKIADFGCSKIFPSEIRSHLSTGVVGTVGYLDPEYYYSASRLTEKSDVYSFGIVLLELITGQPAVIKNHDQNIHIVHWVSPYIERGDIRNAVDRRLQGNFDTNSVWKFLEIAMSCVPSISIQRPTMNHIVAELKECLETEIAREQNCRMGGQTTRLSNSFEIITVDPETQVGPEAR